MMLAVLHRLLIVLTLLAFFGGMTLQLMPPKAAFAAGATAAADDCAHMTMPADNAGGGHKAPCHRGDLSECVKQMGCLGTPSLPVRQGELLPLAYGKVVYSIAASFRDGRSIEPDLFPPIGL